jgi:GNAT superfamily N-acetyltransferase
LATASQPPSTGSTTVELPDGVRIVVRPVRPSDKAAIADAFERLGPESRYRRFFAPLERLTARDLAYLTEVDHHDHEALVGFLPENGEPLGAARFVRSADPAEAEVAVAVVDDWHERGVATALLERLVERARDEGIERFLALVLDGNRDALDLFEHLVPDGHPARRSASGHLELVIELPAPGERLGGSRLGRLLRAAGGGLVINPWRVISRRIAAARPRSG